MYVANKVYFLMILVQRYDFLPSLQRFFAKKDELFGYVVNSCYLCSKKTAFLYPNSVKNNIC